VKGSFLGTAKALVIGPLKISNQTYDLQIMTDLSITASENLISYRDFRIFW
jgi:hypothetical protein